MPGERPPAGDHWSPTLPAADRARYEAAWQAFRACRDCRHWQAGPGPALGVCGAETLATLITVEDYTCDEFEGEDLNVR